MGTLLQDLRYAARSLLRTPGAALAAVVCFALGIGANATIFGVVDTLMFRAPAHVEHHEQVVRLYFRKTSRGFGTLTDTTIDYPLYASLRDSAHAFAAGGAFTDGRVTSLGRGREAKTLTVRLVSVTFFPLVWVARDSFFLQTIGRLRSDATAAQAAYDATMVFRAEDAQSNSPDPNATALLGPVQAALGPPMSQDAKVSSWLAVVTAIVLLIACANVANILLVRALHWRQA